MEAIVDAEEIEKVLLETIQAKTPEEKRIIAERFVRKAKKNQIKRLFETLGLGALLVSVMIVGTWFTWNQSVGKIFTFTRQINLIESGMLLAFVGISLWVKHFLTAPASKSKELPPIPIEFMGGQGMPGGIPGLPQGSDVTKVEEKASYIG